MTTILVGMLVALAQDPKDFPGYEPKKTPDTVLDYRSSLASEVKDLPAAKIESLATLIAELGEFKRKAKENPGKKVKGRAWLGDPPEMYEPSDPELLACEVGERIKTVVEGNPRDQVEEALKKAGVLSTEIEYGAFTFSHVDAMGSGRFFYANGPTPTKVALRKSTDTGEQFYKFKVGTTWVYEKFPGGQTETVKVVRVEEGRVLVEESRKIEGRDEPSVTKTGWMAKEGYLVRGNHRGDWRLEAATRFYKIGSKKGERWKAFPEYPLKDVNKEEAERLARTEWIHLGTVDLKVAAGTYKDVVHVRVGGWKSLDLYLAPGVGIVKYILEQGETGEREIEFWELEEFREGS